MGRQMIRIGFYGSSKEMAHWNATLGARLGDIEIHDLQSDAGQQCDVALVWAPPQDVLASCPNLKGIILQGQGVDHMMRDETVPRDIPLVRLV